MFKTVLLYLLKVYQSLWASARNLSRAGEGISEPLSDILYNLLSDELFKQAQMKYVCGSCCLPTLIFLTLP